MGTLSYCRDYEEAAALLGVVAEYIEMPPSAFKEYDELNNIGCKFWVAENLEGMVFWIREAEFNKTFITFL